MSTLTEVLQLLEINNVQRHRALGGRGTAIAVVDGGIAKRSMFRFREGAIMRAIEHELSFSIIGDPDTWRIKEAVGPTMGSHALNVASIIHSVAPNARLIDCQLLRADSTRSFISDRRLAGLVLCLHRVRSIAESAAASRGLGAFLVNISVDTAVLDEAHAVDAAIEDRLLRAVIDDLVDAGVQVVVAAGNCSEHYPAVVRPGPLALCGSAITVGSTNLDGSPHPWSRAGDGKPDYLLPSGFRTDAESTETLLGTSYSCALMTGMLALVHEELARRPAGAGKGLPRDVLRGYARPTGAPSSTVDLVSLMAHCLRPSS